VKRVQVAVVGGGPAGYAAAKAASQVGAETILLSEDLPPPGLLEAWEDSRHSADIRRGHVVWGLFVDNVLGVTGDSESYELQADQVILATGSTDLPCPFPGGSLPGVFTTSAITTLVWKWHVMPGKRFVVIGGDDIETEDFAKEIQRIGAEIVAWVDVDDIPSFRATGEHGVEEVEVNGKKIQADIVAVGVGRQPDIELALMSECEIGFSERLGGFVPVLDDHLRTSRPGILVAGCAAGICGIAFAMCDGHLAGVSAAHALGIVEEWDLAGARDSYLKRVGIRADYLRAVRPSYVQV
jgi:sarcosine oxidase subunit alpha